MNFQEQLLTRNKEATSDKPNILWLRTDWATPYREERDLYGGIGYYRVVAPAKALEKWFDIEVVGTDIKHWGTTEETYLRMGRDYDLVITKPVMDEVTASNILGTADYFKRKVIVDIDDNFLEVQKNNPAYDDYKQGQKARYTVATLLGLASGLTVSTNPLKKLYSTLNKKIDVLPNCVDLSEWLPPRHKLDGKIRIGFSGGMAHKDDLEMILEPLAYILAKYPNVIFEICGVLDWKEAMKMGVKMNEFCKKNITAQFKFGGGKEGGAWQGYPELLNSFGWDIVIAPLIDNPFNQSKSHIRWMESAMIGCPVVASPLYPYIADIQGVKTIQDGITGMLAYSSEDWFNKLSFLVEHPIERLQLADNALNYVKENWTYERWADKYKKVIEKYL